MPAQAAPGPATDHKAAVAAGADHGLAKPFSAIELLAVVNRWPG